MILSGLRSLGHAFVLSGLFFMASASSAMSEGTSAQVELDPFETSSIQPGYEAAWKRQLWQRQKAYSTFLFEHVSTSEAPALAATHQDQ